MLITLDISNPPKEQDIIEIPLHFCNGKVVEAGGYGFEERKTGKWIDDGQYADYHSEHGFHCSVCGGCIIDYVCQVYDENPHCKWCGAKMEGAEE